MSFTYIRIVYVDITLEPFRYFFFLRNLYIPMKHHFENCFEDKHPVLPWLYAKKTLCINLNDLFNLWRVKFVYIRFAEYFASFLIGKFSNFF